MESAASTKKHDIVVVGHITKDIIVIPGRPDKIMPGGTVKYSATALQSLGRAVSVVTRAAPEDHTILLGEMASDGIHVVALHSRESTVFENSYEGPELAVRKQRVSGIADPFDVADAEHISAEIVQLGPLTCAEMSPEFIAAVAATGSRVAMDIQGYTRRIEAGVVRQERTDQLAALLRHVSYLKADDTEARVVTGAATVEDAARELQRLGPSEVLITFADRGSLLLDASGEFHRIPAFPPAGGVVDATGCGDTYFAAYLHHRLDAARSPDPSAHTGAAARDAARFAAAASSIKLQNYGPFRGTVEHVVQREKEHS